MMVLLFFLFLVVVGAEIVIEDKVLLPLFGDGTAISASPAQPLQTLAVSNAFLISAREEWGPILLLPSWTLTRKPA